MHAVAGMLVAASNWEAAHHMMLVHCISDSLDVSALVQLLDRLDQATLALPMGELGSTVSVWYVNMFDRLGEVFGMPGSKICQILDGHTQERPG